MANPFSVNVPSVLEALMAGEHGFDRARAHAGRKRAQAAFAAGDVRQALAELMGAGDPKMLAALAHVRRASGGDRDIDPLGKTMPGRRQRRQLVTRGLDPRVHHIEHAFE